MNPISNKPTAFVSFKLWVPYSVVDDVESLKQHYTVDQYNEQICHRCTNKPDRHNDLCDECPKDAYHGQVIFYSDRTIHGDRYIGLPLGDRYLFKNNRLGVNLKDCKIIDKRIQSPFGHPVVFTGKLFDYQQPVVDQYLKAKYGLMRCPPRTGKGPMSVYLAVKFGQKTLYLAKQKEFLEQIENHVRNMTNINDLEEKTGKKLCGFPRSLEDYDTFLFCMATYQRFITDNGKRLLARIKNNYGMVIIDEAHSAAALCFASAISTMYPKYMMGMTATPKRKDGRHIITEKIIGPVTAASSRESLPVTMLLFTTGLKPKKINHFTYAMRYLSRDPDRNEYILKHILHDLKNPEVSIVMPMTFVSHVLNMVRAINCDYGSEIAAPFLGGAKNAKLREDTLERARRGEIRVTVGIRRLMELGLDCPRWNTLYETIPISNQAGLYQETSRIRTPDSSHPNKQPRIKFFVDTEFGPSFGCFKATLGHLRSPDFKDYRWSAKSQDKLRTIMSKYIMSKSGRTPFSLDVTTAKSKRTDSRTTCPMRRCTRGGSAARGRTCRTW
jgi:superfamily II DNA or RNA helicase